MHKWSFTFDHVCLSLITTKIGYNEHKSLEIIGISNGSSNTVTETLKFQ